MQNNIFFFKSLISYIFRYACLITKFTNRIDKISITPKFPAPKHFFYFWILFKNLSGSNTFHNCYNLCWTQSWYRLYQKVDMIIVRPNLKKMNFIPLFYFKTNVLQRLINFLAYNYLPIFCRTNKMILQNTDIV